MKVLLGREEKNPRNSSGKKVQNPWFTCLFCTEILENIDQTYLKIRWLAAQMANYCHRSALDLSPFWYEITFLTQFFKHVPKSIKWQHVIRSYMTTTIKQFQRQTTEV